MKPTPTIAAGACAVAFKEWAGVCDALAEGRQSLILRKGGVSEGPDGFRPEHPAFWLYPTHVHEAEQGLRTLAGPWPVDGPPGTVAIAALAVVEWTGRVERAGQLGALADLHDWTGATVRKRFDYRSPGLWALAVRVYRRAEPWRVEVTPAQLGCKTWVPLETPLSTSGLAPSTGEAESGLRLARLREALGAPAEGR